MNGNVASSSIKNNFLPIIDRPLFRALVEKAKSEFSAFQPVTVSNVYHLLHGLSSNKATGVDKISSKIIKIAAPAISDSLTYIFNQAITLPFSLTNGKRLEEYLSIKMANETCQEITDQFQFCLCH